MNIYKTLAPYIVIGSLATMTTYYGYYAIKKCLNVYHYVNQLDIKNGKNTVMIKDSHIIIHYTHLNTEYSVRIPYNC